MHPLRLPEFLIAMIILLTQSVGALTRVMTFVTQVVQLSSTVFPSKLLALYDLERSEE